MNPYEVLGVARGASQKEIKKAYLDLVKKYHPDKHKDNPLSGLAEERFKEIQAAYDMLKNGSGNANNGYSSTRSNSSYSNTGSDYDLNQVKQFINMRDFNSAESILNSYPNRNGEWYYLKAVIAGNRGQLPQAKQFIAEALRMDPGNIEYQNLSDRLSAFSSRYTQSYGSRDMSNDLCCNSMMLCCCANMCCN